MPSACPGWGSAEGGEGTQDDRQGPGPCSPASALGNSRLFLAQPLCSLASCHFSGSGCQNCRRRLLRGSAQPRPAPPRPSALIMGQACVFTHAAIQRGATSNITETPPPLNLTSLPPKQECREKHGVKGSLLGSAHTPRMGQGLPGAASWTLSPEPHHLQAKCSGSCLVTRRAGPLGAAKSQN